MYTILFKRFFRNSIWFSSIGRRAIAPATVLLLFAGGGDALRGADPLPFILDFKPVPDAKAYEVQWLKSTVIDETKGTAGPLEKFEKPPFEKDKVGTYPYFRVRSLGPFDVPGPWSKPRRVPDFQKARVVRAATKKPVPSVKKVEPAREISKPRPVVAGFVDIVNAEGRKDRYFMGRGLGLGAADARSGVQSIFYRINDGPFVKYKSPLAFPRDGVYRLRYYSTDKAGNREPVRYTVFRIDRTPPSARVEFARNLAKRGDRFFSGKVNKIFLFARDDGSGLREIRYRVFTDPGKPGEFKVYSGPLDFEELVRGGNPRYILEYFALDKLNNRGSVRRVTLIVRR